MKKKRKCTVCKRFNAYNCHVACYVVNFLMHDVYWVVFYRCLLAKCWTGRKADEWQASIEEVAKTTAKDYTDVARFEAFAPVREKSYAQW